MSRLLRPAYGLSRSEFHRARDSARSFTTSQFLAQENKNNAPRPTLEQRSERTSKEVNDLLGRAAQRSGPASPGGAGTKGKVINLQSLPRKGARGGGLGIFGRLGRGGTSGGAGGGMGRGTLRGRGRDSGATGGAGGAKGGRRRRKKSEDPESQSDQDYAARREAKTDMNKEPESLEERQARIAKEVGVETQYNPSTSLETLKPFLPDVPVDSNPLGRVATAMTNMRVLAGGHIDDNPIIHRDDMYRQYKQDGAMFFTDLRARKAVEEKGEVGNPDDTVKNTITKRAVMGEYDPVERPDVKDPLSLARNALRKSGTYQGPKVEAFETKLAELVAKAKTSQSQAKGKADKPQEKKGKVKA